MTITMATDKKPSFVPAWVGWALVVVVIGVLLTVMTLVRPHHKASWADLPEQVSVGQTIGQGGGTGSGAVLLQHVSTPVAVHIKFACKGAGTVGFSLGGGLSSGQCFAHDTASYELTLPPTTLPGQLSVQATAGVMWRVSVSS